MIITVKLFATLRAYHDEKIFPLEIEEGTSILDVIKRLDLPESEVAIRMVNGRHQKPEYVLAADDVLGLFPAVGGG